MNRNLIALHLEREQVLDSCTDNAQVGNGALGATQTAHNLLLRHLDTSNNCVVDHHDTVASQDTHLLGRAIDNGLDNDERVLHHIKLHANTLERAVQGLGHGLCLFGSGISGVWVQLLEHAADGVLYELLLVDLVYIKGLDGHLGNRELAQLTLGISAVVGDNHLCRYRLSHQRQGHHCQEFINGLHTVDLLFVFFFVRTVFLNHQVVDDEVLALHGVLTHVILKELLHLVGLMKGDLL